MGEVCTCGFMGEAEREAKALRATIRTLTTRAEAAEAEAKGLREALEKIDRYAEAIGLEPSGGIRHTIRNALEASR